MTLFKGLLDEGFSLPECEKHFHDTDETWLILAGHGVGYWIDRADNREEFVLDRGDVWLIPAGYEHGSDGIPGLGHNSADFRIAVFRGSEAPGSHLPGHYYVEDEGYIPSFQLIKTDTNRYAGQRSPAATAFQAVREIVPPVAQRYSHDALVEARHSSDPDVLPMLYADIVALGQEYRSELEAYFDAHPELDQVKSRFLGVPR